MLPIKSPRIRALIGWHRKRPKQTISSFPEKIGQGKILDKYLDEHNLPNEHDYFDPTKVEESRECGLHTQL